MIIFTETNIIITITIIIIRRNAITTTISVVIVMKNVQMIEPKDKRE